MRADGIFCVLCVDDNPLENPDVVTIEYRLFDPAYQGLYVYAGLNI